VVTDLRQILIIGYIVGLLVYSLVEMVGASPLLVAAVAASMAIRGCVGTHTPRPRRTTSETR
jgi:hypothetical protein